MGLAGPKVRNKIGHDPNNTNWSNSTDRFGHKILTSQGWTPGATLGATGASHASYFTAASSSHVRVALREDGLGLGAKIGRAETDTFGLELLQGLLGRLNGKSDQELRTEAGHRRDVRLKDMVFKKFGATTFVSGGFLVGDKIEQNPSAVAITGKSKKRKRGPEHDCAETALSERREAKLNKERKKGKKRKVAGPESLGGSDQIESQRTGDIAKKHAMPTNPRESSPDWVQDVPRAKAEEEELDRKRERMAQKLQAKEQRRKGKEDRRKAREDRRKLSDAQSTQTRPRPSTTMSTPSASTCIAPSEPEDESTHALMQAAAASKGRFLARARHLQQKRMAVSDPQALREIFMIKSRA